jgi:dTDP-4-amino-4,6-dideoxygalactose transaminase
MNQKEIYERKFYSLDEETLERIAREVVYEELSVVEGGILDRFERAVSEFFGARHAVAACNGTAALHLALFALDIKPGDEVLIPAYGYYAMALPVCMLGGVPVFCDVREEDMTIDIKEAEKLVSTHTRAVIVHQPWGCPANVDELRSMADRHGLILISDSSHAHGALWNGRPLGHYYDFVCASFGKGKLISGGELGAVTTSNDHYRDRMLLYGHVNRVPQGLITPEYRHMHNAVGVKYRPHPFAMALAFEQLMTYHERSKKMFENAEKFEKGLADIVGFEAFCAPNEADRVYWRIPVRVDKARFGSPERVLDRLISKGCPVEMKGGLLISQHNAVTEFYGVKNHRRFPVSEQLLAETLQVQPFALYDEKIIQEVLEQFRLIGFPESGPK